MNEIITQEITKSSCTTLGQVALCPQALELGCTLKLKILKTKQFCPEYVY